MIKAFNEASQLAVTKMVEKAKILTTDTPTMGPEAQAWYAMKRRPIMQEMKMAAAAVAVATAARSATYTSAMATATASSSKEYAESPAVPKVMEETTTQSTGEVPPANP
jgi:predicted neutral ceramidase superfamily lipid hydrolase